MLHGPLNLPYKHTEHEGIPLPACIPQGRYQEIADCHRSRKDDLYIATYPKSGTTWLQHIVNKLLKYPRGEETKIDDAIPWPAAETQQLIDGLSSPRVLKTHMKWRWVPKASGIKYIYCYRNPKDLVVSYYNHTQIFKSYKLEMTLQEYIKDIFLNEKAATHGSYFDHVAEWLQQKNNENILFMTYEDMSEDLLREVRRIVAFLELDLTEDDLLGIVGASNFESMKANDKSNYSWIVGPNLENKFLRKGKVGDWMNHLSDEESRLIEEKVNDHLIPLGGKIRYSL